MHYSADWLLWVGVVAAILLSPFVSLLAGFLLLELVCALTQTVGLLTALALGGAVLCAVLLLRHRRPAPLSEA